MSTDVPHQAELWIGKLAMVAERPMTERVREGVGPLYLFTCLILGGSAQGIWQNMVLQLLGVAIIAWAAWSGSHQPIARPARQLLILALLAIALVALQMIPLPPSVWAHLGGRALVSRGFACPRPRAPVDAAVPDARSARSTRCSA